jgi:protein arginine kinase
MILRTKTTIYRNIFPYKFVSKLNSKEIEQLSQKITKILFRKDIIKENEIEKKELKKLKKLDLIESFDTSDKKTKYFYSSSKKLIVEIISKEHLIITAYEEGKSIEKTLEKLSDIENKLSNLTFSYSKTFGFLTSDIEITGFAKTTTFYIFIPALTISHKIEELSENLKNFNINLSGFFYNPNPYGFFKLKFIQKENDDDFKEKIENTLNMILSLEEKESKNHIHKNNIIFKDRILKSFGILKNAYIITDDEYFKSMMYIIWGYKEKMIEMEKDLIEKYFFELINTNEIKRVKVLKKINLSAKI